MFWSNKFAAISAQMCLAGSVIDCCILARNIVKPGISSFSNAWIDRLSRVFLITKASRATHSQPWTRNHSHQYAFWKRKCPRPLMASPQCWIPNNVFCSMYATYTFKEERRSPSAYRCLKRLSFGFLVVCQTRDNFLESTVWRHCRQSVRHCVEVFVNLSLSNSTSSHTTF